MAGQIAIRGQVDPLWPEKGRQEFAEGRARARCLREGMSPSISEALSAIRAERKARRIQEREERRRWEEHAWRKARADAGRPY